MKNLPTLVIATRNKGKVREFEDLLTDSIVNLKCLSEFDGVVEIAETGRTFAENAMLKAVGYAAQIGLPALADDSGLEVAALGNAPGVFSARYGGTALSDAERTEKLLFELEKVDSRNRRARFVCVIALADKTGRILGWATGVCNGRIAAKPLGTNGFGYDPIFIPDGFETSFGELSADVKGRISHRARAAREIMQYLQDFSLK